MLTRLKRVSSFFFVLLAAIGCEQDKKTVVINENAFKKPLMEINKSKVEMENDQIDKYIKRRNWPVEKTGTGLRYWIYKNGNGLLAKEGQMALVNYTVTLINGDTAYTTSESGPQEFLIGMSDVESGLHEGVQYLHVGDKAKLILPSFLAHGLVEIGRAHV